MLPSIPETASDATARLYDLLLGAAIRGGSNPIGRPEEPVLERFLSKVEKTDGCWLWLAKCSYDGYATFWFRGKQRRASRMAHLLFIGPIPEGHEIDHNCRNPRCVNPEHLEAVTPAENQRRRRTCDCGTCKRCLHRDRMREYLRRPGVVEKNRARVRAYRRAKRKALRSSEKAEELS